jgi:hypothetical protein
VDSKKYIGMDVRLLLRVRCAPMTDSGAVRQFAKLAAIDAFTDLHVSSRTNGNLREDDALCRVRNSCVLEGLLESTGYRPRIRRGADD